MRWVLGSSPLLVATILAVVGLCSAQYNSENLALLHRRGSCRTIVVQYGQGCGSLAQSCGITGAQFTQYNPQPNLCSTLQSGQKVCCSPGGLPTPQENANGTCASYTVQKNDSCPSIANNNCVTVADLETWNANTWGWRTCNNTDDLLAGENICISAGNPPMPNSVPNTVCGPQVPGTQPPTNSSLASLNLCPLNACCDIWGQCGTTSDFCMPSGSGAPGTAAPNTNGCISNCGTNITNNASPPSSFKSVGYYEAFNIQRPCLNMDVVQINTSQYTHIHFAFGNINNDFSVDVGNNSFQFSQLLKMSGVKRILTFGGWGFSTSPSTYDVLRSGVTAANRQTLASNIAKFVVSNGLDGVDIDWEYPGETDIDGIPADNATDAANYAAFLTTLKAQLPSNLTLSIAAPASFWYLKAFPIKAMSQTVDYIVFMTYDLHGQWDYNNSFADPGCPQGSCLRSHVNLTETMNALSMITKAGVPSNKVVVGVSSYGRSFQMTTPGCTGPMCTFTGPASGALPGPCTQTAGYLADAEIYQIINENPSAVTSFDNASDSNILVYNSTQWVAYMDADTRASRTSLYKSLNMGGVADWAVDLENYLNPVPTAQNSTTSERKQPFPPFSVVPWLKGCSKTQLEQFWQTWEDASYIAYSGSAWRPGEIPWQPAMDLYMGFNSRDDSTPYGPGQIQENMFRENFIHAGSPNETQGPAPPLTFFYCTEAAFEPDLPGAPDSSECAKIPYLVAYTWSITVPTPEFNYIRHYVAFCDWFWNDNQFPMLSSLINQATDDPVMQTTIDYWRVAKAHTVVHETYHWYATVSIPRCLDYAYSPQAVVELAQNNQTYAALNAESYSQASMAMFVQKTFSQPNPPQPAGGGSVIPYNFTWMALDSPPANWTDPWQNGTNSNTIPSGANITYLPDVQPIEPVLTDYGAQVPGCTPGSYTIPWQCSMYCNGGTCTQAPNVTSSQENTTTICSNCQPQSPICNEGELLVDIDMCLLNCEGGQCYQNAQETGFQCLWCPGSAGNSNKFRT